MISWISFRILQVIIIVLLLLIIILPRFFYSKHFSHTSFGTIEFFNFFPKKMKFRHGSGLQLLFRPRIVYFSRGHGCKLAQLWHKIFTLQNNSWKLMQEFKWLNYFKTEWNRLYVSYERISSSQSNKLDYNTHFYRRPLWTSWMMKMLKNIQ